MAAKRKQNKKPGSNSQKKTNRKKISGTNRVSSGPKKPQVNKKKSSEPMDLRLLKDLVVMILFAISVLLFLSNFHLCGSAGEVAYVVQRGLFGVLGYAAPVVLFICVCFLLASHFSGKSILRSIMFWVMFSAACGITELMASSEVDISKTLSDYYAAALTHIDGGAVGGFYLKYLFPVFGTMGSYVVMILIFMIAGVIVTQRSLIQPIEDSGKKVYKNAKEDMQQRAVIREEQKKIREEAKKNARKEKYEAMLQETREQAMGSKSGQVRRSQKVQGVNLDALIIDESDQPAKPSEKQKKNSAKNIPDIAAAFSIPVKAAVEDDSADPVNPADFFVGEIHGLNGSGSNPEISADEVLIEEEEEADESFRDREPLRAQKVSRALEKETLKKKKSRSVKNAADAVKEEKADAETGFAKDRFGIDDAAAAEKKAEINRASVPEPAGIPVNQDKGTLKIGAYDAVDPAPDSEVIQGRGGKQIIRELDPTEEDIIQKKLREQAGEKSSMKKESGESIFRASGSRSSSGAVQFTDFTPKDKNIHQVITKTPEVKIAERREPERPYIKPPKGLLKAGAKTVKNRDAELRETAVKLQQTLQNFNVGVTVTNISCGPSVTRYELTPEQGVKVSRIVSLQDDIKLSLAAADIRIEAPIPGKSAVGIEVPNKENMTVALRDILDSEEFNRHPSKLAFGVGRDIAGNIVVTDLAKMPHLLIAGATGSGKSVCINTLIMSIIYKADPKEVRLIMVDPKVVELSVYNGIPHLLIPVVTDPKKAAGALNWAVANMTDRYKKFAEKNVRDLRGYNERIKEEEGEDAVLLPQIVIIVDELADLMMVAPGEVEDAICRLAQMARAAGIHLVLATQRPSVNVITGLIKANVPSRIAFSVSSGVDSRTIIDMVGAEKLLGKGDMLFYPSGFQKPARVQGAFVSDEEVSAVVKFLTDRSEVKYSTELENSMAAASADNSGQAGTADMSHDALFTDAGRFIIDKDKASIGMLQRAFKIGFNRAARIMDQLAEAGVVGEEEGTKPRKILMTRQDFDSQFGGQ